MAESNSTLYKRCSNCNQLKPTSEFFRASCCKDGLRGECKTCVASKQRVIGEYEELRTRTIALGNFLPSKTCLELDQAEQARLRKQWNLMNEYGLVLADRIAAFKQETPGKV